jgi:hypothetical protein
MGLYENINTKKIDIFSELFMPDNSSNKKHIENFQTESMVHKLTTIKKKKKKQLNNFKNIEELQNIHQEPEITQNKITQNKNKEPPIIEGYQQYAYEKYKQKDIYKKNCDPNLYDGCDSVNENKNNADDPRARLIGVINKAFQFFDEKTYLLADTIRKALSFEQFNKKKIPPKWLRDFETKRKEVSYQASKIGKGISENERKKMREADLQLKAYSLGIDPKEATPEKLNELRFTIQNEGSDTMILKKYISWFVSIVFSCFAVYNWFFVMYYRNKEDNSRVNLFDITRRGLYNAKKNNYFLKLIYMFFQFAMFIPEKFELYFVKNIPDMFSKIMNPSFCFMTLFFGLIYFINNCMSMAKMFIVDSIMLDLRNFIVAALNTIVVFLFGIHMVTFEFYFDVPYMIQEAQKMAVMSTLGIFFMIFFRIIHFVIILFISVPVGGVLLMLYVLFTSLFGIFAYSGFNPKEIIKKIIEINKFTSFKSEEEKTECDEPSIFDRFIRIINYVSDFFYKYCFWIAFIYMLIYASIDYMSNIKAPLLKTSLLCINAMLILLFAVLCYTSFKNKTKNEEPPPVEAKEVVDKEVYKKKVNKIVEEAKKTAEEYNTNNIQRPSAPVLSAPLAVTMVDAITADTPDKTAEPTITAEPSAPPAPLAETVDQTQEVQEVQEAQEVQEVQEQLNGNPNEKKIN